LFVYAETVVQDEWPALAAGRIEDEAGWQLLDRFHLTLVPLRSQDPAVQVLESEMIRNLNALYDARRGRFHAARIALPPILWLNLIAGAALTILFSYLFGPPNFVMHMLTVSILAASIALVLTLIILLENPFRGRNHISVVPFERLVKTVEEMAYPRGR
jgi:ABC-type branched-subunit amino acid transport system permease subunit